MNPAAGFEALEALEALDDLHQQMSDALRLLRAALHGHQSRDGAPVSIFGTEDEDADAAADAAHRVCSIAAGIAMHATDLAETAGVQFHVGRDRFHVLPGWPWLAPREILPGLSLPAALAALRDARAAGTTDADLFTSLRDEEDA